ncbi:MAG TPA: hypothetical protein VG984_03945 [Candidatus Paceibacterota bacterium]|nr:hypothetical protein [Candidatus Paceibacterota bacterium]
MRDPYDDKPVSRDYLEALGTRLKDAEGVTSISITNSKKVGAATADLYCNGASLTVDHHGRRLTIEAADPSALVKTAKDHWRQMRGPKLRDRTDAN